MAAEPTTKKSPTNPRLDAALSYARLGWRVVPLEWPEGGHCHCGRPDCQSPAKHPLTAHGLKDASINPAVIRHWWEKWPKANIAVITGAKSGLVVLDIDKKGGGFDSLTRLEKKGNLPLTPQVSTGGGGRHYYLAHNGKVFRNKANLAGLTGIDVRGDGGYIVAPPSLHISGDNYTWDYKPDTTSLAAIPAWLYEVLQERIPTAGAQTPPGLNQWTQLWAGVAEPGRNVAATRLAGRLLARGLPEEEVIIILTAWNHNNTPALTTGELEQAVLSISRAEAAKPQAVGVMPAEYFMNAELERPPSIVSGGIIMEGSGNILAGVSGAGKSLITLEIAIRISKGMSLWDFEVDKARQVLFIQKENPDYAVQARLRRLCSGLKIKALSKIHFAKRDFKADLNNTRDFRQMQDFIEKVKAELVVLDPLSSYHRANENDNIQMRQTLDHLTDISAVTGCAWLIVHHESKPQDGKESQWRFRGASSIRDWADTMISYVIKPNKEGKLMRLMSFDKIRHGPHHPSLLLERDENFVHHPVEEESLVPASLVAECLIDIGGSCRGKGALVDKIMEMSFCSKRTAYYAIEKAEQTAPSVSLETITAWRLSCEQDYNLAKSQNLCKPIFSNFIALQPCNGF